MKYFFICLVCLFVFVSCLLKKETAEKLPSVPYLANFQWHLISVTNINPAIARYKGTNADSMRFTWKWAYNGNVLMDSVFYYKNGNISKYSGNFLFGPSDGIWIDTVQCVPNWKTGYSDKLIIRSIEKNFLVFTVISLDNSNIETDSLYHH
jgi:hypothetical protein